MSATESEPSPSRRPITRAEGVTPAERRLQALCDRSFLSLWSYAGVFKDQFHSGPSGFTERRGHGKEVCDLLVVFENHIIIFSDKECEFPDSGDLDVDWGRWYRRAVLKSAEQIWHAERWIRKHPDRLFVDPACMQRIPIPLPEITQAKFHRVVVAHGAAERCQRELRSTGSLMIDPRIVGKDHLLSRADGGMPLTIGQLDPDKGYVHVLDDATLEIVLSTLDTVSDFVEYLEKKEDFVQSGKLLMAAGEEELLAYYLQHFDEDQSKGFILPDDITRASMDVGLWDGFTHHPSRLAQIEANKVSYEWDLLIETFAQEILAGTEYFPSPLSVMEQEPFLRLMARESRMRRRMLGREYVDLILSSHPKQHSARVVAPSQPGEPYYVFVLAPRDGKYSDDEYRNARTNFLYAYCLVTKFRFPDAVDIVGIATESGLALERSKDGVFLDGRKWTLELEAEAQRMHDERGLLNGPVVGRGTEWEYPEPADRHRRPIHHTPSPAMKGRSRNQPCPCDSGKKFKHCCGSGRS